MRYLLLLLICYSQVAFSKIETTLSEVHKDTLNLLQFNTSNKTNNDYYCSQIINNYIEYKNRTGETIEYGSAFISNQTILKKSISQNIQENTDSLKELNSIYKTELFPFFDNDDIQYKCEQLKSRLNNIYILDNNQGNYSLTNYLFNPAKNQMIHNLSIPFPTYNKGDSIFTSPFSKKFYRLNSNIITSNEIKNGVVQQTGIILSSGNAKILSIKEYDFGQYIIASYTNEGKKENRNHFIELTIIKSEDTNSPLKKIKVPILKKNAGIGPLPLSNEKAKYAKKLKIENEDLLRKNIEAFLSTINFGYRYHANFNKIEVLISYREPFFRMLCGIKWNSKKKDWDGCKSYGINIKTSNTNNAFLVNLDTQYEEVLNIHEFSRASFHQTYKIGNFSDDKATKRLSYKSNNVMIQGSKITTRFKNGKTEDINTTNASLIFSDKITPLPQAEIDSYYIGRTKLIHLIKDSHSSSYKKAVQLISEGAKVDLKDFLGKYAIHYTVVQQNQDKLNLLLNNMANPDAQDRSLNTPLHLELIIRFQSTTAGLLNQNEQLKKITIQQSINTIDLLLKFGARIDIKNKERKTFVDLLQQPNVPQELRDHYSNLITKNLNQDGDRYE